MKLYCQPLPCSVRRSRTFPRCLAVPGDRVTGVVEAAPWVPLRNPPLEDGGASWARRGVAWKMKSAFCEVIGREAGPLDVVRGWALRALPRMSQAAKPA